MLLTCGAVPGKRRSCRGNALWLWLGGASRPLLPLRLRRGVEGTPYGLAGICTSVWEVVLDRVRVTHYGMGHAIVIVLAEAEAGEKPGSVIASWYGP
jgi:hypothetical protein